MRNLLRNKQTIYYQLYEGKKEEVTADGLYTGGKAPKLSAKAPIMASISAARGSSDVEMFGVDVSYTHTVIVDDMNCPINEHSRLSIGDGEYAVVRVARSLNHIAYAVKEIST